MSRGSGKSWCLCPGLRRNELCGPFIVKLRGEAFEQNFLQCATHTVLTFQALTPVGLALLFYWLLTIDVSIFSMRISAFALVCLQVLVEFRLYLQLGWFTICHGFLQFVDKTMRVMLLLYQCRGLSHAVTQEATTSMIQCLNNIYIYNYIYIYILIDWYLLSILSWFFGSQMAHPATNWIESCVWLDQQLVFRHLRVLTALATAPVGCLSCSVLSAVGSDRSPWG